MRRLIKLYPARWRERDGDEFGELVASLEQPGLCLAIDIVRGALDAHLQERLGMRRFFHDPAVRRLA
jgi:hypothetical protein